MMSFKTANQVVYHMDVASQHQVDHSENKETIRLHREAQKKNVMAALTAAAAAGLEEPASVDRQRSEYDWEDLELAYFMEHFRTVATGSPNAIFSVPQNESTQWTAWFLRASC